MATYTSSLGLELITPGSQAGLWGNTTNNTFTLIDQAVTGVTPISFAAASGSTYTLTDYNGALDEARSAVLNITGSATGANTVVVPNKQKTYLVRNNTGKDVTFQTATPTATYSVGAGYSILIFCDGNNNVYTGIAAPSVGTLAVSGGGTGATTFTAGFVKSPGGTSALTTSATVSLASEVAGTLPVTNGGTGLTSPTAGAVILGNGTGSLVALTGGTSGHVLTWNGSAWASAAPTTGVTSVSSSTIGVSPTSGNVVITLSSSNVTTALGYTPVQPNGTGATGTWGINISGNAATATSASTATSATTASTATSATTATTATNQSGGSVNATTGSFSSTVNFSGVVTSTAYNMTSNTSIYWSSASSFVGISSSGTTYAFYTTGNATAPGTWQSLSDLRLKENIAPLDSTIDKVMQLNPVEFSMKADQSPVANRYGLIAQELEQIFPITVTDNDTDYDGVSDVKSVSYTELVPVLIKAVQELKAEIEALKAAK